jgi:hypothetical protein
MSKTDRRIATRSNGQTDRRIAREAKVNVYLYVFSVTSVSSGDGWNPSQYSRVIYSIKGTLTNRLEDKSYSTNTDVKPV